MKKQNNNIFKDSPNNTTLNQHKNDFYTFIVKNNNGSDIPLYFVLGNFKKCLKEILLKKSNIKDSSNKSFLFITKNIHTLNNLSMSKYKKIFIETFIDKVYNNNNIYDSFDIFMIKNEKIQKYILAKNQKISLIRKSLSELKRFFVNKTSVESNLDSMQNKDSNNANIRGSTLKTTPVIRFSNVSKIFSNESGLKEINLEVKKGSFHALIGANGAGKTTLIRSLLRIYKKYDGEIFINDIKNENFKSFKGISYISELPIFPNEFTAFKYLMWSGKMVGLNEQYLKVQILKLASKFQIDIVLNKKPNKFSSGQKQKLMLMKVIIENADIIIMDEPTANLDPSARIIFFNEIKRMNNEGKTIFLCSHNLDEIEKKVSWVTVLKDGVITYNQKKDERELIDIFKEFGHEIIENNDFKEGK